MLSAVDVVIAMADAVPDSTAFHYARRLYASLFAGVNVADANEQACAVLSIDDPEGAALPTVLVADGVDIKSQVFA